VLRLVPIETTIQAARVNSGNINLKSDFMLSRFQFHSGVGKAAQLIPTWLRNWPDAKGRESNATLADRDKSAEIVAKTIPLKIDLERQKMLVPRGAFNR